MRVKILSYLFLIILVSTSVQAFGIAYEYMEDNSLFLYPGQSYMFKLEVQNTKDEGETVNISLSSAIATLVGGPELDVPGKTYDRHVFFNITVPEDAQNGDIYNIKYMVSPVGKGEGQVPLAVTYTRKFQVTVVPEPVEPVEEKPAEISEIEDEEKQGLPKGILIPIVVIVVIVLVVLLWKKSHQMSGNIFKAKPKPKTIKPEKSVKPEKSRIKIRPPRIGKVPNLIHKLKRSPEHPKHVEKNVEKYVEEHVEKRPAEPEHREAHAPEKKEKTLKPSQYFHSNDGRSLRDLEDLHRAMETMSDKTFSHHVNSTNNDFARWVAHTLEDQGLANKLSRTTSKKEMLGLIENELEKK